MLELVIYQPPDAGAQADVSPHPISRPRHPLSTPATPRRPPTIAITALAIALTTPLLTPTPTQPQGTRFLRQPDVSATHIVFTHANDLWKVARDGGDAVRLTSSEGAETAAAFSPDGRWIAFTGQYDGNTDVYLMPATGGQPRRLTWHPSADVAQGWTPDGDILFQSGLAHCPHRLQAISPHSQGLRTALPMNPLPSALRHIGQRGGFGNARSGLQPGRR